MQSWLTVGTLIFCSLPALAQPFDPSSTGRMAISGNGKRIAVASEDKHVRVWDLDMYDLLFHIELPEPGLSVALDQTGQELLVGTHGNRQSANEYMRSKIGLWNLAANEPLQVWETQVIGGCQGLAFAPKSDWVAAICVYSRLCFFDKKDGKLCRVWGENGNGFWDMDIDSGESLLITVGQQTRFWDLAKNELPKTALPENYWSKEEDCEAFQKFASHSGGADVIVSSENRYAYSLGFYQGTSGRAVDCAEFDLKNNAKLRIVAAGIGTDESRPACIALSHNNQELAFGMSDGRIEFRDLQGNILSDLQLPDRSAIRTMAFIDQSRRLAITTVYGANVYIWNVEENKLDKQLLP